MNYLPFCGYWFYGGQNAGETAAFYCSYGLLATAPAAVVHNTVLVIMMQLNHFMGGIL